MAKLIYKYELPTHGPLALPRGAKVLSVGTQNGTPHLWAEVDPDEHVIEGRTFVPVPTGGGVYEGLEFIGSCHGVEGWMVFHIYEQVA